jgi:hypothetical protein
VTRADLRLREAGPWIALAVLLLLTAFQLRIQGRWWWCACGQLYAWSGDTWSRHNSQHLCDPYIITHVLHGMVCCGLIAWTLPRLAVAWQFFLAVLFEALWEVVENTDFIIQRYRAVTASLDYLGDTVANSLGDILGFAFGFALARRLGLRASVALFMAAEVLLLFWIRDSLLLNVLMLIYPIDAIRAWQLDH